MSVMIDDKQEILDEYKNNLFAFKELKEIAKKRNCIIVADELEGVNVNDTYMIWGFYKNVTLYHNMIEMKNYMKEDGTCDRPDDQGVICVTENGKRDFCKRNNNLLMVAVSGSVCSR